MNKNGIALPIVFAVILGISILGIGSYVVYDNINLEDNKSVQVNTNKESDLKESGEEVNTTEINNNSNDNKFDIISRLAKEKAPSQAIDESYVVKNVTINNIDIYDEAYVAVSHDYWNNTLGMDVDTFKRLSDDSPESDNAKSGNLNGRQIEAIGKITWTVEYDKDLTNANISFAGGGQSQIYKNNLVESYIFYLYKDSAGKYELETGTGW